MFIMTDDRASELEAVARGVGPFTSAPSLPEAGSATGRAPGTSAERVLVAIRAYPNGSFDMRPGFSEPVSQASDDGAAAVRVAPYRYEMQDGSIFELRVENAAEPPREAAAALERRQAKLEAKARGRFRVQYLATRSLLCLGWPFARTLRPPLCRPRPSHLLIGGCVPGCAETQPGGLLGRFRARAGPRIRCSQAPCLSRSEVASFLASTCSIVERVGGFGFALHRHPNGVSACAFFSLPFFFSFPSFSFTAHFVCFFWFSLDRLCCWLQVGKRSLRGVLCG